MSWKGPKWYEEDQERKGRTQQKTQNKYEEYFKEFDKKAGPIHNATKPVGRPNPNTTNIPFEEWDWQKNDPDFYASYMRIRDSKDPELLKQVKWNRYHQSLAGGDAHMRDFRFRTLFKRMKFEIFLFSSSIVLGFMCKKFLSNLFLVMPWYFSYKTRYAQNNLTPSTQV